MDDRVLLMHVEEFLCVQEVGDVSLGTPHPATATQAVCPRLVLEGTLKNKYGMMLEAAASGGGNCQNQHCFSLAHNRNISMNVRESLVPNISV